MGFSLVEFLIYLCMIFLLGMILLQGAARMQTAFVSHSESVKLFMQLQSAQDALMRDLYSASSDVAAWKILSPEEIVFKNNGDDIGWSVRDNALYRVAGTYDQQTKAWSRTTKSLIAMDIRECFFTMKYDDRDSKKIRGMQMFFAAQGRRNGRRREVAAFVAIRDHMQLEA